MSTAPSFVIAHLTDLLPDTEAAFLHVVALAHRMEARLVTMHASPQTDDLKIHVPDANAVLRQWARVRAIDGPPEIDQQRIVHTAAVDVLDTLVESVSTINPDLLVMSTRQPKGLTRWIYGSTSQTLAHDLLIPTLFLPVGARGFVEATTGKLTLRNVLIPAGSQESVEAAVELLLGLVGRLGLDELEVLLLNVGEGFLLDTLDLPTREGVHFRRLLRAGNLQEELLACADSYDVDLIVMATSGHDGLLDILRGSRTERVVRHAHRAILAVPTPDAV